MDLELSQYALILIGGLLAGVINGTVGGGSLLTYPLLVAAGLPPVLAAATNTTGLAPGNAAALIPHRRGQTVDLRAWLPHAAAHAGGALIGGTLLIALPERVFEFIVPWLLVAAALLTLRRPRVDSRPPAPRSKTLARLVGSGVYQGYFGPGQGVVAVAVLFSDGRLSPHQVIVVKNLVLAASNVVVAAFFLLTGHVVLLVALALTVTAIAGAWTGGHLAQHLPGGLVRWGVAAVGFASATWFVLWR